MCLYSKISYVYSFEIFTAKKTRRVLIVFLVAFESGHRERRWASENGRNIFSVYTRFWKFLSAWVVHQKKLKHWDHTSLRASSTTTIYHLMKTDNTCTWLDCLLLYSAFEPFKNRFEISLYVYLIQRVLLHKTVDFVFSNKIFSFA